MAFPLRIGIFTVISMAFFNQGATYLNTGELTLAPAELFTVTRLRDNMEDVLKWTWVVGDGLVTDSLSSETPEKGR